MYVENGITLIYVLPLGKSVVDAQAGERSRDLSTDLLCLKTGGGPRPRAVESKGRRNQGSV